MSIFTRLFQPKPSEEKVSRAYQLHMTTPGQPVWTSPGYIPYANEGYSQNVIAYQAINKIVNAVATIRWQAKTGSTVLDEHPILALIRQPNPLQSGPAWWRARIINLFLSGNLYDERFVINEAIKELWVLRSDRVDILPSRTGLPAGFVYKLNGEKRTFAADPMTGDSDINHTRLFDPLNDWSGMSSFKPASYAIDQHNEAMRWMQSLLQNSARPSGALVVDSETSLSDDQIARLKAQIDEQYSGGSNAGRPMLLEGGLDWKEMGLSPEDMSIDAVKDSAARDISLAFGVPPLLLNIPGDNTFANYREARLGFYEDTIVPFVAFLLTDLNKWLSPYFDAEIVPDLDSIEALAEKRRGMWEMVDSSDELTVNEARRLKGLPDLEDAATGSMLMADLRASRRGHTETPAPEAPKDEV